MKVKMKLIYQMPLPLIAQERFSAPPPIDDSFDVAFADLVAQHESYNKHLYRPNTYLHKWWARRCGSTFRLILKHLIADPAKQDYYAPGGLEGKIVLDPMIGGGTTLHEAIRLGANVVGADIDPIPVLQARAALSYVPLRRLEEAFDVFYTRLYDELQPFFRTLCPTCGQSTDLQHVLYGARRSCRCGPVLSIDSTTLRYNSDGSVIQICPRCHRVYLGHEPCTCSPSDARIPLVEKGSVCARCGATYQDDSKVPFYARYVPLVVVGECPVHGLFFTSPGPQDREAISRADALRHGLGFCRDDWAIEAGPKSIDLIHRGVTHYLDLFSGRQLLYLRHAIDALAELEPAVRLNLGLLVSTSIEFNSMLCGYKGGGKRRPGAVRHTFSHHAYSIPHTALENNPLYPERTSGTLKGLFHSRIRQARKWAARPTERRIVDDRVSQVTIRGEVDFGTEVDRFEALQEEDHRLLLIQGSSACLDLPSDSVDYVVTDPPYFDSVQYSDLAAFFRVWLRRLLPDAANWDYDLSESAVDPQANGNGQYTQVLGGIWAECHRVLKKPDGRLIFTFHHWDPKGWAALTKTLQRARFVLLNRYVVHAENPASVHIQGLKSLTHDAILVLAPHTATYSGGWTCPDQVDKTDSMQFCSDCAAALGWMLDEMLDEQEIDRLWHSLLEA